MATNLNERVDDPSQAGVDRYVGLEHLDPDSLKIVRWGKPADVEATKLRFYPGDIIFGKRRFYQRKLAVADFEGICSAHALVLRAKEDTVDKDFLPFFMLSDQFFDRAMMISVGGLSPTINWSTLAKQEFAIPPKPEQRRIAEILWAAEVAIGGGVSLIERVARTRDAYTALFFGAERRLASGIRCVSLTDIVSHASDGPFGSNLKTMHYTDSGPRVIRLQNIADGFFDDADKACIAQSHYDSLSSYHVRPGDVIVAGLGDETHAVGRACQVSSDLGPAVHKADCFCLRANTEVVSQRYLLYYLNSPAARLEVRRRAQGTTRLRINVGNLKQIPAPVYAKPVQEHICDTIDGMNAVLAHTENRLARLRDVSRALRERLLENSCSQKQIA